MALSALVHPSVGQSGLSHFTFLVGATRLYNPLCWSVGPSSPSLSIHPSHFTFVGFCGLWSHCSCPSDQVTSNIAPAHPHATGAAVYPALLNCKRFLHYCPCSIIRDCPAMYPAWFITAPAHMHIVFGLVLCIIRPIPTYRQSVLSSAETKINRLPMPRTNAS